MTPRGLGTALRAATPGAERVVHLNFAGTGLPSAGVLGAVREHLEREETGGYEAELAVADEIAAVPGLAAAVLGCEADEVAITTSASESTALALAAIDWRRGDRIVCTREEYVTQAVSYRWLAERRGVEVVAVAHGEDGVVDLDALDRALEPGARLVSLVAVPMWTGVAQPVAAVAERAHAAGALMLLDAAQSLGQMVVDAARDGADLVVATGRKWLRGPRGTGLLVVRGRALDAGLEPPLVTARSHELLAGGALRRVAGAVAFTRYEANVAAVLGLGVACAELASAGPAAVADGVAAVAADLRRRLADVGGLEVADPPGATAGIVAARVPGREPPEVAAALRERGVQVWHVPAVSVPWSAGPPTLRLSPHALTSAADLDRAIAALEQVVAGTAPERVAGTRAPRATRAVDRSALLDEVREELGS